MNLSVRVKVTRYSQEGNRRFEMQAGWKKALLDPAEDSQDRVSVSLNHSRYRRLSRLRSHYFCEPAKHLVGLPVYSAGL
jgi:hypothetical protein